MIREIDSRTVPGTGATVELVMEFRGLTDDEIKSRTIPVVRPQFYVFIKDASGKNVTTLGARSGAEAVELFRHPFASATTPDIFRDESY